MFYTVWTADMIFGSPVFYLICFLFAGVFVCFDTGLVIYNKEIETNLHDMFKSIQRQSKTRDKDGSYSVVTAEKWYELALNWHYHKCLEEDTKKS